MKLPAYLWEKGLYQKYLVFSAHLLILQAFLLFCQVSQLFLWSCRHHHITSCCSLICLAVSWCEQIHFSFTLTREGTITEDFNMDTYRNRSEALKFPFGSPFWCTAHHSPRRALFDSITQGWRPPPL